MKRARDTWPLAVLALAVLAAAAPPAAAGEHESTEQREIEIRRHAHDCAGDDCGKVVKHHRVIVIDDDGEVREVDVDETSRVGHGGRHALALALHGKGGFLGVATTELTPELRRHFGAPGEAGVLVARVVDDSAAARAGVQVGDVLTAVDGQAVESSRDLVRAVRRLEPGAAIDLELWRDGTLQTLGATLGERQRPRHHALRMHCDDDEDCPHLAALHDFDCGEDSDCEIRIECRDAGCDCTVNGEPADCETLPGFSPPGE